MSPPVPPVPIEEVTPDNPRFSKPRRRTISLRWLLALVFGGLLTISIIGVIAVSVGANVANTFDLLKQSSIRTLNGIENSIRDQVLQADRVVKSVGEIYKENGFELGDMHAQENFLKSLMRAAPVVEGLLVFDLDGKKTGMLREKSGNFSSYYGNKNEPDKVLKAFDVTADRAVDEVRHSALVEYNNELYQAVSYPLVRNDRQHGVVVALIGGSAISQIIEKIGRDIDTPVFLLDGESNVVAYSKMPGGFDSTGLFPVSEFPNELLRELHTAELPDDFRFEDENDIRIMTNPHPEAQIFIVKELKEGKNVTFTVGVHFFKSDLKAEVERIVGSALVGLAMLFVAVLIAIYLGRKLAKPMTRIARAADHFSNFELEKFKQLPNSRIQEIDDQAGALNAMHTALSEFSQYVPRTVVQRLLQSGKDANRSVEREVTIMFSDIVSFTSMSEHLNAIDTAKLLNDHFDMICKVIDKTNGTVDKFIGDSVMAFWGAPNADDGHAKNAVLAAEGISRGLAEINIQRGEQNLPPIRLRIGLHTGRVIVGNIGGGDRQNYTLVGDNVNVGQRLEQLGKSFMEERNLIILASEMTVTSSNMANDFEPMGSQMLRGRETPISVFALKTDEASMLTTAKIISSDIA